MGCRLARPSLSRAEGAKMLERRQRASCIDRCIQMKPDRQKPVPREQPAIRCRGAEPILVDIAGQRILRREQLKQRDSANQRSHVAQRARECVRAQQIEESHSEHQIVRSTEVRACQGFHTAEADVPGSAEPAYDVFRRIESGIPRAWPQREQRRAPVSFASADVEYGAQAAAEHVLSCCDRNRGAPGSLSGGEDALRRIAVPAIEVAFVVA